LFGNELYDLLGGKQIAMGKLNSRDQETQSQSEYHDYKPAVGQHKDSLSRKTPSSL